MTRRVVTGDVAGRSTIVLDGLAPETWCEEIWASDAANPLGIDRGAAPQVIEPPAGGSTFRITTLLPHEEMLIMMATARERAREQSEFEDETEVDDEGFHRTNTLDYIFVLDGPVELALDDGTVELNPGDAVVQRQTNHAWRNRGENPIRLLNVMIAMP